MNTVQAYHQPMFEALSIAIYMQQFRQDLWDTQIV